MGKDHKHRISTYKEAETAIRSHEVVYINPCFCRKPAQDGKTQWKYCGHPIETCMGLDKSASEEFGVEFKKINQKAALKMFDSWKNQGNIFRFMADEKWICFCCTCGCQMFRDEEGNKIEDTCDPSSYIESTDLKKCTFCGKCVNICPKELREIKDKTLTINTDKCYGCSACESICPENAVSMIPR